MNPEIKESNPLWGDLWQMVDSWIDDEEGEIDDIVDELFDYIMDKYGPPF